MNSATRVAALLALALSAVSVSAQPTNAPTMFPTKSPTTLTPTASPTIPLDLCTDEDDANWLRFSKNFDSDLSLAGVRCAIGVATEAVDVETCIRSHFANISDNRPLNMLIPPLSFPCSVCFGRYAACMLDQCNCIAARDSSERCVVCSVTTCEDSFFNCTGGFELPPYGRNFEDIGTDDILVLAGAGGGVALVLFSGVAVFMFRRSRLKRSELGRSPESEVMRAINEAKRQYKANGGSGAISVPIAAGTIGGGGSAAAAASSSNNSAPPPVPGRKGFMGFGGKPAGDKATGRVADRNGSEFSAGPPTVVPRKAFMSMRMPNLPGRSKAAPPSVPVRDYGAGLQSTLSNPVGHKFVVTMPFVGTNEDELTLTTNTRVTILEKLNDDWVRVRVDSSREEGMVLASHLRQA